MITATVEAEIRRMLQEGRLSQRKIASQIGVSRGTVNAIALGKRPCHRNELRGAREGFIPPTGPLMRCPGCGGRVQMPCLLCYIRTTARPGEREGRGPC